MTDNPIAAPGSDFEVGASEQLANATHNAIIYSACQAINGSAVPVNIALGGLAGAHLLQKAGASVALATAPVTTFMLGIALGALAAANLMRMTNRRTGFLVGTIIGASGLLVSAFALYVESFLLFSLALTINGVASGFTQQFRFAAADTGSPVFKAKAISWVLAGGVLSAIIGPQLIIWSKDALLPVPFAGAFAAASVLFVIGFCMLLLLRPVVAIQAIGDENTQPARALGQVISQPKFIVAVICGTGAYSLMSFIMTAAPLAMVHHGISVDNSTLGIQWHVLAMYAPSFITGHLIARFGKEPVVASGLLILISCALVALAGVQLMHFWGSLILLGIGWNFGFIGATAMVTETYRDNERGKAQGANDFILFGFVALSSLLSGVILSQFGWVALNWLVLPVVVVCLLALGWLSVTNRRRSAE